MRSERVEVNPGHLGWFVLISTVAFLALGKSFAYLHVGPLYVAEFVIIIGLAWIGLSGRFTLSGFPMVGVVLIAVSGMQVMATVFDPTRSLLEALRNWVPIYYMAAAVVAFSVMRRWRFPWPDKRMHVVSRRVCFALVGGAYLLLLIKRPGGSIDYLAGIPIIGFKPGDVSVGLFLVIFMWTQGLVSWRWAAVALPPLVFAMTQSRSVLVAGLVLLVFSLKSPQVRRMSLMVALVSVILLALDTRLTSDYREVSVSQLGANVASLIGGDSSKVQSLRGSKEWRQDWWGEITEESNSSERILSGLGWDVNLADRYGFQTAASGEEARLRHPHNVLMGVLGRGGWAAALLWLAFYASWFMRVLPARRAEPVGSGDRLILSGSLVVVCVGLIQGFTDVFLESPQNAYPHFIAVGAALGVAARLRRDAAQVGGGDHARHRRSTVSA